MAGWIGVDGTTRDPEELEASGEPDAEIAAGTRIGAVELTVADLDRSLDYYRSAIGLELIARNGASATLGAGGVALLRLAEEPRARPAIGCTGLYHFALLVPTRPDLALWLAHAARDRVPLTGLSDHFVSEAIYLRDPDAHGIEIYADRPRSVWEGAVGTRMTTLPLDVDDLLGVLDGAAREEPFAGLPAGTVVGHMHLRVAAIPETVSFYRDVLGFGLMAQLGRQAAFLSAGGYHHHLGANTWESAGARPAPPGTATLRSYEVVLPDTAERARVVGRVEAAGLPIEEAEGAPLVPDPSGNAVRLTVS